MVFGSVLFIHLSFQKEMFSPLPTWIEVKNGVKWATFRMLFQNGEALEINIMIGDTVLL